MDVPVTGTVDGPVSAECKLGACADCREEGCACIHHEIPQRAECPRCCLKAEGADNVDRLFGFRRERSGQLYAQSHCRTCRKISIPALLAENDRLRQTIAELESLVLNPKK